MKNIYENYSSENDLIKANLQLMKQEAAFHLEGLAYNELKENRTALHYFIVDWQIPAVDIKENISVDPVNSIHRL